ncbi:hypothetical protein PR048_004906, partial [Dryococelus australis]
MQGQRKREIPEKTSQSAASSSTIPTCENPGVTRPGIEPGFPRQEASSLTAQPPRPLQIGLVIEQRRNVRAGETGNPRVDSQTGIVRHDSHMRKSETSPAGNRTRFAWVDGHGYGAGDEHREQPDERDLEADEPLGGVGVPGLERVADAQVPAQADEAHVHDAGRAREHVARHVHVAPGHAERPVACNTRRTRNYRAPAKLASQAKHTTHTAPPLVLNVVSSTVQESNGTAALHYSSVSSTVQESNGTVALHYSSVSSTVQESNGTAALHYSSVSSTVQESNGTAALHYSSVSSTVQESNGTAALHYSSVSSTVQESNGTAALHYSSVSSTVQE